MSLSVTARTDLKASHAPGVGGLWVNVLPHLDPKYGGMSSAVPALSAAISRAGNLDVVLAAFCALHECVPRSVPARIMPLSRAIWFKDAPSRKSFAELVDSADGIHIHGLWEHSTFVAARAARSATKPYLISAHGMLQSWALKNKRWKKVVYGAFIERANLKQAQCLHALSHAEAKDYRSYGLTNPIAIIPNGVDLPANLDSSVFLNSFPHLRDKRIILFLSRIHFKKGVDILCEAWSSVSKRWPDAHLVLAGPDFENTQVSLEAFVRENGISNTVTFTGMLDKGLKWSALAASECFVLPSYSEGLSVSVLEALSMGIPVIVSHECNVPEVTESGCGWEIGANVTEIETALNEYLASPSSVVAQMGANGHRLARRKFGWHVVGDQMNSVYQWLQGGPVPDNVEMDFGGKP